MRAWRHLAGWPGALALAAAALAWWSPVSNVGSDAALQLVAAQALVQQGTLDLGVYEGDARLRYDLEHDYRVWRAGGRARYYLVLPPVLDAPFVWLANRAGLDMLRAEHEAWLQNALSALVCAAVFLALHALCLRVAPPRVALALAGVATFGSPLVSTLGTALWPAGHALLLVLAGLLLVVRVPGPFGVARALALGACLAGAYLCRPASAFCAVGLAAAGLVALPGPRRRPIVIGVLALAALMFACAALLGWYRLGTLVPRYYSPLRLWPNTPLGPGLYGALVSPGRGLFVFCPFLLPVALGAALVAQRLRREPLAWLALVWLGTQTLFTAVKSSWWGGNSYGPRLLLETIPAWTLLAALVWSQDLRPALRRGLGLAFAVLGAVAIAIHSGQGLWNPAVQAWNRGPSASLDTRLILDWRFPQALATTASVSARDVAWQVLRLVDLRPGDGAGADSRRLVFLDFHPLDGAWRPTAASSRLRFRARGFSSSERYLLELQASAPADRHVLLELADWEQDVVVAAPGPFAVRVPIPADRLEDGEHELRLEVPGAASAAASDPRVVGVFFHALRFLVQPAFSQAIDVSEDARFLSGFAAASPGGRWTVASEAHLLVPWPRSEGRLRLELEGFGNGTQELRAVLDSHRLGTCTLLSARGVCAFELDGAWLRDDEPSRLVLQLPEAHALPSDPRRLGLFLTGLNLRRAR